MDRDDVYAATARERRRLADLIGSLDEVQLATPSLCAEWDVKTVGAHLVSNVIGGRAAIARLGLRYRSLARATNVLAQRRARSPAAEIAEDLHRLADRRYPNMPPRGDKGPLADVLVHSADIRLPLGLPFDPDPQLAAEALDRADVGGVRTHLVHRPTRWAGTTAVAAAHIWLAGVCAQPAWSR